MTDTTATPATVKLKFLADYTVQDEHAKTDKATIYKKGAIKLFTADSAQHFVRKGLAEVVAAKAK